MKICNLIGCILMFPTWFGGNCMWYCALSPCAMGLQQLNKSKPIRMILLAIFICPIIAIVGCFHWLFGIPKTLGQAISFIDGDPESGFQKLVIPENHNTVVDEANGCIDKVFACWEACRLELKTNFFKGFFKNREKLIWFETLERKERKKNLKLRVKLTIFFRGVVFI